MYPDESWMVQDFENYLECFDNTIACEKKAAGQVLRASDLVIVGWHGEGPQSQKRQDGSDYEEEAWPLLKALKAVGQVAVGAPIC